MSLTLSALPGIPHIQPGDNLGDILSASLISAGIALTDGDIIVIAQKIISKAENRYVNLQEVIPSAAANELALITEKDPRFVELILRESNQVIRTRQGTIIVEHRLGFICANAGIDHSNVLGPHGNPDNWVLLLPEDPSRSARLIRTCLEKSRGVRIGVLIIDSHGRAWRTGISGISIGLSGMPGLVDMRGRKDMYGYALRVTQIAVADELAAAASLVMGQAAEGKPAVHVRGFPYPLNEGSFMELLRPKDQDLFR